MQRERAVLAFDGSYRHDSTGIVGATVEAKPHLFLVGAWEKPLRAAGNWRVPRREVESVIEMAMETFDVVELVCDPPGWHREIEDWAYKWGDVVAEFDTNQAKKFGPACDQFEQAIADASFTHDGSEQIRRHVGNIVARRRGGHIVADKSEPNSPDRIDLGVCSILAIARAFWHFLNEAPEPFFEVWN